MIKSILLSFVAVALALVAAPGASAQTSEPVEVMFHWGPVHRAPGQAIALNLALNDHFSAFTEVLAEFRLEDKNGNVIYSNDVTLSSGQAFTAVFAIGPEYRIARSTIEGDIYGAVGPEFRTLQPCIKVLFPPGPGSPVDSLDVTLEVLDVLTGRVQVIADPHIRAGIGVPQ